MIVILGDQIPPKLTKIGTNRHFRSNRRSLKITIAQSILNESQCH